MNWNDSHVFALVVVNDAARELIFPPWQSIMSSGEVTCWSSAAE